MGSAGILIFMSVCKYRKHMCDHLIDQMILGIRLYESSPNGVIIEREVALLVGADDELVAAGESMSDRNDDDDERSFDPTNNDESIVIGALEMTLEAGVLDGIIDGEGWAAIT